MVPESRLRTVEYDLRILRTFMSMASMTASRLIRWPSTTSMRAAGYIPRQRRSDFQQTMVSKRPRLASASILWKSGRFVAEVPSIPQWFIILWIIIAIALSAFLIWVLWPRPEEDWKEFEERILARIKPEALKDPEEEVEDVK